MDFFQSYFTPPYTTNLSSLTLIMIKLKTTTKLSIQNNLIIYKQITP